MTTNLKIVAFAVCSLTAMGCDKGATPKKVCEHMQSISGEESSPEQTEGCVEQLTELQGKDKAAFEKTAACLLDAKDKAAIMPCMVGG